ncbi:MAG: hypothetical protein K9J21_09995 [Bacteroidales bacterium]|nr:hypothetical protein [Bacteroidales bacterium]
MKKLSYLVALFVVIGAFTSCTQQDSNHSVQGNWNVDSINADNVTEYAQFMSKMDQQKFAEREKQMRAILDTIQEGEQKKQVETALENMQSQKDQITAENYEQRIVEQNKQSQNKFTMSFKPDSSFLIVSDKKDTVQQGTWEKSDNAVITHMNKGQYSDTLEIKSTDDNKMKLLQQQEMSDEFTLDVYFYLTKKTAENS